MKQLILLRHAKAVRPSGHGDHERELAPVGRIAAERIGVWIRDAVGRPDAALVSDARRTRETFVGLARMFPQPLEARAEAHLYDASCETILDLVRDADPARARLLVVGHNPGLAELAILLAGDGDHEAIHRLRRGFPTGAAAVLTFEGDWRSLHFGGARLQAFKTPAALDAALDDT